MNRSPLIRVPFSCSLFFFSVVFPLIKHLHGKDHRSARYERLRNTGEIRQAARSCGIKISWNTQVYLEFFSITIRLTPLCRFFHAEKRL
jgi:hypothetical protein